jgi:dCTP diphosphatase
MNKLDKIKVRLRQFADERDWDQFHSPKNLAMALIVEAAELVEHFQWLTEKQSQKLPADKLAEVEQEIADIQIYLIRLADKLGIDMEKAVNDKIKLNEKRYPADKVRGKAGRHEEYDEGDDGG